MVGRPTEKRVNHRKTFALQQRTSLCRLRIVSEMKCETYDVSHGDIDIGFREETGVTSPWYLEHYIT